MIVVVVAVAVSSSSGGTARVENEGKRDGGRVDLMVQQHDEEDCELSSFGLIRNG